MKDYLRATFVVNNMKEVVRMWAAVEQLKKEGKLKVLNIKNRLRCVGARLGSLAGAAAAFHNSSSQN